MVAFLKNAPSVTFVIANEEARRIARRAGLLDRLLSASAPPPSKPGAGVIMAAIGKVGGRNVLCMNFSHFKRACDNGFCAVLAINVNMLYDLSAKMQSWAGMGLSGMGEMDAE